MTDDLFTSPVRTQADLESAWRRLMGPQPFDRCSVWMMLIQDDVPIPQLTEITDAESPDHAIRANLAEVLRMLAQRDLDGVRFAFLVSRPGSDFLTTTDREWATTLYAAARIGGVACEVVHLATAASIRPIPPDELEPMATSA